MPNRTRIAWAAAWLALMLALATPVRGQQGGVLTGQVENGTAGGPAAGAGLAVTLHITGGETEMEPLQATTDSAGSFRFDSLSTDPELLYWPEVTYQGVAYGTGQGISFAQGEQEQKAGLTVYEPTEDGGQVRIESVHIVAQSFEQMLRVSEVHVLGNVGDRTFVGQATEEAGGRVTTLFIPLPENAVGVAFPEGEPADRFVQAGGGLWDTQPVPPGSEASVVRFSYHLVAGGSSLPLERRFAYPVFSLNILAVQPGLDVRGQQLQAGDPVTFQDTEYRVYEATGLGVDAPLEIELVPAAELGGSGMPGTSPGVEPTSQPASVGQQGLLRRLGFVLVVIAGAAGILYPLLTRPRARE